MKNLIASLLLFCSFPLAAAGPAERWIVELREPVGSVAFRDELAALQRRGTILPIDTTQIDARLVQLDMLVVDLDEESARVLAAHPSVVRVERDRPVHAFGTVSGMFGRVTTSAGTTSLGDEIPWGVSLVKADKAWGVTRGEGVKLAVADSGIDLTHPDLIPVYAGGFDFVQNDATPQDENGHGTHVAGTIAAAENGSGVVGVAPGVKLYALRVLDKDGNGFTSAIVKAIDWAITNGIHVMNFSLGSSSSSTTEEAAFQRAADAGIVTVAATGNSFPQEPALSFPAGYRSVISVGAVDDKSMIGSFSQRGTGIDVVAPGVGVYSTVPAAISSDVRIETSGLAAIVRSLLAFSPRVNSPISGAIHFSNRGLADSDFAGVAGKIALIERGDITFAEKVTRAKSNGAIAAIIFNNSSDDSDLSWTLGSESNGHVATVGVTQSEGQALKARNGQALTITFSPRLYGLSTGTSMATPHAAGVVALIRSRYPGISPHQVRQILDDATTDIGDAGYDLIHGWGLIDAEKASKASADKSPRRGVRK